MRLLPTKIAAAVLALEAEGVGAGDLTKNLVAFLRRKRSLRLLVPTKRSLERLIDEQEGKRRVTAIVPQQLEKTIQDMIRGKAQSLFGGAGKEVELTFQEDPQLIGGIRILTEDTQYDFSLSRSLKELKRQL